MGEEEGRNIKRRKIEVSSAMAESKTKSKLLEVKGDGKKRSWYERELGVAPDKKAC